MSSSFALLVLSLCLLAEGGRASDFGALPIFQSVTSTNAAWFSVLTEGGVDVTARVKKKGEATALEAKSSLSTARESARPGVKVWRFMFDSLAPGQTYWLEIVGLRDGKVLDRRQFQTFSSFSAGSGTFRFLVSSCLSDSMPDIQKKIWAEALSHDAQAIFIIGDLVYADWRGNQHTENPSLDEIWKRYVETRVALSLFRQEKLIPVFSLWDDHDTGSDNAYRSSPHMKEMKVMFREFFPSESLGQEWRAGPGQGGLFHYGDFSFHLMDGRTFREVRSRGKRREAAFAHWGKGQEQTMLASVAAEKDRFHFIMSGDQVFGGYAPRLESYEGDHPKSFGKTIRSLAATGARFALISGDRHFLEYQKLEPELFGFPTFEVTTSAMHAILLKSVWEKFPNRRQVAGFHRENNYVVIEAQASEKEWTVRTQGLGVGKRVLFSQSLSYARPSLSK